MSMHVARLSVLHYDTIAHIVNIPGKSKFTGSTPGIETPLKLGKSITIFVSTNSKPDPYLGLKDHTD